ncbi:hypothetical protein [Salinarchaeum laminariae]|uniref:hypothetical protein n=1 Tax=Salinarchaeum laminariae TaxID=869888 RepID=UPI0020C164CE|nr:hypothetical protein [Salinarchaeum laminariae]
MDFDDVRDLSEGDAIAARSISEHYLTILAGRIQTIASDDPDDVFQSDIDEDIDNPITLPEVVINGDVWWEIEDDGLCDLSDRLDERPPYQRYHFLSPQEAPQCRLALENTGRVKLVIPTPNSNGSRVTSYTLEKHGYVDRLRSGPVVNPELMLPDRLDRPTD